MTNRTRIKICGIKEPETLNCLLELGVDAFGLMFYEKSHRAITLKQAKSLLRNTTPFINRVAVFVNPSFKEVAGIVDSLPINLLQFHGDEPDEFCHQFGLPYIKAIRCQKHTNFDALSNAYENACAFLLDSDVNGQFGGTGETFDWTMIPTSLKQRMILAGGLTPENVSQAIDVTHPYAVDVSGGVENVLGTKDNQKIELFVDAVKRADQHE